MALFGKKKGPDPAKRECGHTVAIISPLLFVDPKDLFKELRETLLPYLSEEEEGAIVQHFQEENKSFRALVPASAREKYSGEEFKHFLARIGYGSIERGDHCSCGDWSGYGCCQGITLSPKLQRADHRNPSGIDPKDEELKNYFIIEHIEKQEERRLDRHATVAHAVLSRPDRED